MNIYAGREFGWDWQAHINHGYLGGDDMKAKPGELILAPVAGTVTRTAHSVTITEPDGWKTQCLELESTVSQSSVQVGHGIGFASSKWPHWHSITPDGTRVPARFLNADTAPPVKQKATQEMLSIVTRLDVKGTPTYLLTPERIYRFIDTSDLAAFQYANPAGRAPCTDKQLGLLLRQFGWTNFVSVNELAEIAPGGERLRGAVVGSPVTGSVVLADGEAGKVAAAVIAASESRPLSVLADVLSAAAEQMRNQAR